MWTLQAEGDELELAPAQKSGMAGQLLAAQPVPEQYVQVDATQIELFCPMSPFLRKVFDQNGY